MKVVLLNLHSMRHKVRYVLSLSLPYAFINASVYHCSYSTGGSTYCGIGALSLLGKLPIPSRGFFTPQRELQDKCGINDEVLQDIVRYLVYRQVRSENEEDSTDLPLKRANSQKAQHMHPPILCEKAPSLAFLTTDAIPPISTAAEARASPGESACAGFNGRCNKVADTCYSWWVGGSLGVS